MRTFDNDPAAGEIALQRGIEAARAGLRHVAASHFERAAELTPENPNVWLWLAWSANSPDNSIRCLERVLELSPGHEIANAGLVWARLLSRDVQLIEQLPDTSAVCVIENVMEPITDDAVEDSPQTESCDVSCSGVSEAVVTPEATVYEPFKLEPVLLQQPIEESPIDLVHQPASPMGVNDWDQTQSGQTAEATVVPERQAENEEVVVNEQVSSRQNWSELVTRTEVDVTSADSAVWSMTPPPLPTERLVSEAVIPLQISDESATRIENVTSSVIANTESFDDSATDVEALAQSLKSPTQDESSDGRPLVLVVDDSPTVRKLVSLTLERRGYRVITAFDGVAAIKELGTCRPDLILLDINMPRLDGYRLCKLIKKHEATQTIPVVMLSGKDGMFDKLRGRLVGCSDYITKPFEADALSHKVAKYLIPTSTSSL